MQPRETELHLKSVRRPYRGAALLAAGGLLLVSLTLPWTSWVGSSETTSNVGPFDSTLLGPFPGIVAILCAFVFITVGFRDLGVGPDWELPRWRTTAVVVGLAVLCFELLTKSLWENSSGGVPPDSPTTGVLCAVAALGIGVVACIWSALSASRPNGSGQKAAPWEP
jgi:hypothetical protein